MIDVGNRYSLSPFRAGDEDELVKHLNCVEIHQNTLRIPFPYHRNDARFWIDFTEKETRTVGETINFAIRDPGGQAVGGIGLHDFVPGASHKAEIGYWLAKSHWGRGIGTRAVGALVMHAHGHWGLVRITAHVFSSNVASRRVLEKNGFREEGYLRKHYLKNGSYLDSRLYARLLEDPLSA